MLKGLNNEVISLHDPDFWREVGNDEIDFLLSSGTLKLVDLLPSCNRKLISIRKLKEGFITGWNYRKIQARQVGKGFKQRVNLNSSIHIPHSPKLHSSEL